jgi:hypothetical protein
MAPDHRIRNGGRDALETLVVARGVVNNVGQKDQGSVAVNK